jgi:hypothetical protein
MHRFYRDRKQDKSGLGFVVAVVVTLAAAFLIGQQLNGGSTELADTGAINPPIGVSTATGDTMGTASGGAMPVEAQPFTVHLLQAGAFATREQADQAVAKLADQDIAAVAVQENNLVKVFLGAYMDPAAAETVKAAYAAKMVELGFGEPYNRSWTVTDTPAVVPVTAGSIEPMQQGAQDMNVYLQQAAAWLERYASGDNSGVEVLQATAQRLSDHAAAVKQYQDQDATVANFMAMVNDTVANSEAISKLSASHSAADYQAAMAGYVTLLQEYKAWTLTPAN